MHILLTLDFVEYMINILCNEQSNQRLQIQVKYNAEQVAMQSIQYSQTLKK